MKPYYEHGGVTIFHGDCREVLLSVKADVLVTDPPYGVNLGSHAAAGETRGGLVKKQGYISYDDSDDNLRSVVVPAVQAALSIARRGLVFCAGTKIGAFPEPDAVGGVYIPNGCGRGAWGFSNLSLCLLYGVAPRLELGAKATAISSTDQARVNGHPCPKPYHWMTWAVALASERGDMIVDPFAGSGTTLVAAKDLDRRAIGIEIEERYCEIAAKRLAQETLPLTGAA